MFINDTAVENENQQLVLKISSFFVLLGPMVSQPPTLAPHKPLNFETPELHQLCFEGTKMHLKGCPLMGNHWVIGKCTMHSRFTMT